jgi:hypothetical protein
MPLSKRFQQCLKRLDTLEKHFLPPQFSLSGRYSKQQDDKTKAYLLLVHAELESYFEDRARSRVVIAQNQWQRTGACTSVLSRLLVYHQKEFEPISAAAVTKAVNYYVDKLDKNHGIKEANLLTIFLPLGIGHQQLDSRLVSACNQLSRKRGQFAHASIKTHQQVDPKTERDNVRDNIVPELKKLDRKLTKFR